MNDAGKIFTVAHPEISYSAIDNDEYISLEMADWSKYLFAHIDIPVKAIPRTQEVASNFWYVMFRDLYSKIERLRKNNTVSNEG